MKKTTIILFIFAFFAISCNQPTQRQSATTNNEIVCTEDEKTTATKFFFDDFKIEKGRFGTIKIGMTIQEAEQQFSGLTKRVSEAGSFGFGGGSPAYLYYWGDESLFALIPQLDTDILFAIIVMSDRFSTATGLRPNSTVEELMRAYPDLKVRLNTYSGDEFFTDRNNHWEFVFMTNPDTRIGKYNTELDIEGAVHTSAPKRLTAKVDWIAIRAVQTQAEVENYDSHILYRSSLIGNTIGFVRLDISAELDRENNIEFLNDDGTLWHSFCADVARHNFLFDRELNHTWLSSFEIGGLIMRCVAKSEKYYYVVVNERTNLVKRVRKHNDLFFQPLEFHILQTVVWTDFDINPFRTYPNDDAQVADSSRFKDKLLAPVEMEGEWIKIIEVFSEEVLGWIRWRKGDIWMVELGYAI